MTMSFVFLGFQQIFFIVHYVTSFILYYTLKAQKINEKKQKIVFLVLTISFLWFIIKLCLKHIR